MRTAKQNRFRCLLPPPVLSHNLPNAAPQPQSWAPRTIPKPCKRASGARQWGALSKAWRCCSGRRRATAKREEGGSGQLSGGLLRSALPPPLRSLCPVAPVLHWVYMDSFGVQKWSFRVCVTMGWFPSCFSVCLPMFLSLSLCRFPPFNFCLSSPSLPPPPSVLFISVWR